MVGLFKNEKLRMEMINFKFGHRLTSELERLVGEIMDFIRVEKYENIEIQKLPQIKEIEKIFFEEIGINYFIDATSGILAAVIPFHLGESAILKNDIFIDKNFYLNEQRYLRGQKEELRGWVDDEKVKVGGVFSEYKVTLFLDFVTLYRMNLNVQEIIAIILHETGHAYYACSLSYKMDRGNAVIIDALRTKENGRVDVIHKNLKKEGVNVKREVIEGLSSSNPVVFTQSALTLASEAILSQFENSKYSETTFEQLADNFSARFGYGPQLVTGLEKLYPGGVRALRVTTAINTFLQVYYYATVLVRSIVTLSILGEILKNNPIFALFNLDLIVKTLVNLVVCVVFFVLLVNSAGEDGHNFTYDDLHKRYNRIRHQITEAIKSKSLTKGQIETSIKAVKMIEELIKDVKPYRGPLDFLFNTFNPKDRRAKNSIARQQAIEDLFANSLFVSSMQLLLTAQKR